MGSFQKFGRFSNKALQKISQKLDLSGLTQNVPAPTVAISPNDIQTKINAYQMVFSGRGQTAAGRATGIMNLAADIDNLFQSNENKNQLNVNTLKNSLSTLNLTANEKQTLMAKSRLLKSLLPDFAGVPFVPQSQKVPQTAVAKSISLAKKLEAKLGQAVDLSDLAKGQVKTAPTLNEENINYLLASLKTALTSLTNAPTVFDDKFKTILSNLNQKYFVPLASSTLNPNQTNELKSILSSFVNASTLANEAKTYLYSLNPNLNKIVAVSPAAVKPKTQSLLDKAFEDVKMAKAVSDSIANELKATKDPQKFQQRIAALVQYRLEPMAKMLLKLQKSNKSGKLETLYDQIIELFNSLDRNFNEAAITEMRKNPTVATAMEAAITPITNVAEKMNSIVALGLKLERKYL
jgi:hypothetical protein